MKFLILKSFSVKTTTGRQNIKAGQIVRLPEDKAKSLIDAGLIEPLRQIFEKLFHEHCQRLGKFTTTMDEIKQEDPTMHERIKQAVKGIDKAWLAEDLAGLKKAMAEVEFLYGLAEKEITAIVESTKKEIKNSYKLTGDYHA